MHRCSSKVWSGVFDVKNIESDPMGMAFDALVDGAATDQEKVARRGVRHESVGQTWLGEDERRAESVKNVYLGFVVEAFEVGKCEVGTGVLRQCLWCETAEKRSENGERFSEPTAPELDSRPLPDTLYRIQWIPIRVQKLQAIEGNCDGDSDVGGRGIDARRGLGG